MHLRRTKRIALPAISLSFCLAAVAFAGGSDWNGDGPDSIALYDPASSAFLIRNSNSAGTPDSTLPNGPAGFG